MEQGIVVLKLIEEGETGEYKAIPLYSPVLKIMLIFNLAIILGVILLILLLKKPLYIAIVASVIVTAFLFHIDLSTFMHLCWKGISNKETIVILLVLYFITYLQKMLENRQQLVQAQENLYGIFNNRRINATLGPVIIGLLPSAAAVNICADIVDEASGDYLDINEKTFVTSFFRHIPESFLPTYSSILLLIEISGVSLSGFIIGMIPMVLVLYFLGYIFYVRKIPKATGNKVQGVKGEYVVKLLKNVWSLLLIIGLILAFNISAYMATVISIVLGLIIYRFNLREIVTMLKTAVEFKMLLNAALVMVFREFIQYCGLVEQLPTLLASANLPTYLVFGIIYFIGAVLIGSNAIVAMTTSLAFATVPHAGVPLAILLVGFSYAAMQISPTHYCLFVAIDYFKSDYFALVRKTYLPILAYCLFAVVYYNFLLLVM